MNDTRSKFSDDGFSLRKGSTMADVAKEAGVSPTTVSRALNQHPLVAEPTRQRVLEAVQRLDYQVNETARALAKIRIRKTPETASFGLPQRVGL
jgi:transposase-like protein